MELSKPHVLLDLKCAGCAYEVKVSPSEMELLDKAREATRAMKAGSLDAEGYLSALHELNAGFVKDLVALTQVWKCPKCGEENPANFEACWNC
ncbi:MAG: hypothetical protein AB1705_04805, partial [Verrucomicrobiota bacterium]